jgi:hypothetical protein
MASHKYEIREICGDWALDIHWGNRIIALYFNSRNNAELVKSILEWEDAYPNEAVPYKPTLTPPNEWVSVEERLPEYNPGTGAKSYWVAKKDNAGNWQMKIAQYCDYGYAMIMDAETEVTWRDWDFTKIVNVTHWMPLPAPPTKET